MQLVATGPQDVYLTGEPQITFFKVMYRRYTNFSSETIQQNFTGTPDFGRTVTCIIAKNGDLITKLYLKVIINKTEPGENKPKYGFVKKLGHALIKNVKVELGGTTIDEHYGDWLNIWIELTLSEDKQESYMTLIGNIPELIKLDYSKEAHTLYIPLQFWFCRNNGLALPLISLQYHDLKINVKFAQLSECINLPKNTSRNDITLQDASLLVDYIYLDGTERKRFATMPHEYLIEQLQYSGEETITNMTPQIKLNFTHPCKSLYWTIQMGKYITNQSTIALNDNGNIDYIHFCKILWLVTRRGEYSQSNGKFYLKLNVDTDNMIENNILSPETDVNASPLLKKILQKIKAQFLFSDVSNNVDLTNLFNVFIDEHILTDYDISLAYNLIYDGLSQDIQKQILDYYAITFTQPNNYGMYIDGNNNPISTGQLLLNGHSRFSIREGDYFNYVQPYQHFTRTPNDGINVYSFSLNPEEHQPSGSCNMSRIDNVMLNLSLNSNESSSNFYKEWIGNKTFVRLYTINYNVLRIMGGMGGLAYLN